MTSGFGVQDVVKLINLSSQMCKCLIASPGIFKTLISDVKRMHAVLLHAKRTLEQQDWALALQEDLISIASTCESVLYDVQKLVDERKSLGIVKLYTDESILSLENVDDIRGSLISVTSLLAAFEATLHRQLHEKILKDLEYIHKDIREGQREESALPNLAIEDLQSENEDTWRRIVIELEEAGFDTAIVQYERPLITSWLEENISNGGCGDQSIADSPSRIFLSNSAPSNTRGTWESESLHSLARLLSEPLINGSQNPSSISLDRASFNSSALSTTTIRPPTAKIPVACTLDSNEILLELEKLSDLVSSDARPKDKLSLNTSDIVLLDDPERILIMGEEQLKAIVLENWYRAQRSRFERPLLPLPWGWKWSPSYGLYENSITSDLASNIPLLDVRSFIVMSHELLPRCIKMTTQNWEILTGPHFQLDDTEDSVQQLKWSALYLLKVLIQAMSKFDIFLENTLSTDHIYTQILLLKEFDADDSLLQSILEPDLLLAKKVYSTLIRQVLSLSYSLSDILSSVDKACIERSANDLMVSHWQKKKMAERTLLLKQQSDSEETWTIVEMSLKRIWSWYTLNREQLDTKTTNIALFWSRIRKVKYGAAGDEFSLKIHSAMSSPGGSLEKRHLPYVDRIGAIIAVPFVPLDKVHLSVRVLADGVLLFQTFEDERVSLLSRFSWDMTRTVFLKNCNYLDFQIWDRDALSGLKSPKRQRALAVGRVGFKSPISTSATLDYLSLRQRINIIKEVQLKSAKHIRPWGRLKVEFSWEGRDSIVAKAIATKGLPAEMSQSKVLEPTFADIDYTKETHKTDVY